MRVHSVSLLLTLCLATPCVATAQLTTGRVATDVRQHETDEWRQISMHLPDPKSSTNEKLELSADILRARRYPLDAMDYYRYSLQRGGDRARLLNKIGLVQLEINDNRGARQSFVLATKINKKYAEAWNNLGTVDYLDQSFGSSIGEYKKAIKLDKKSAVFHANLAASYFSRKDMESAQKEFQIALKLDPHMYEHRGSGGVATHVISAADRARFCFELARVYARNGDKPTMYRYLAKAAENGLDVSTAVQTDEVFRKYLQEPQLALLVRDTRAFLAAIATPEPVSTADAATPPPLPAN
ncbi:tetratricopeptide repeat protein [Terriglobus tenax]|uniref:tetratricopeptide repeat protein n=1 Tax=Terriglobus tenax TaxID=1111115 RepID=UPI0021DFC5AD|nr:tetratricopeptide repeat protein [Terriglobus tenax]